MIKMLILLLGIYCCLRPGKAVAQINNSQSESGSPSTNADLLLKKARMQKTIGWVLLGTGGVTLLISYLVNEGKINNDFDGYLSGKYNNTGGLITSGVIMAACIPMFIASGRSHRRAEMIIRKDATSFLNQKGNKMQYYSIGVRISIYK